MKVSKGFWIFSVSLFWCYDRWHISPILWSIAECECLCLKTPKFNHFLRCVLFQSNHRLMSSIQPKRKSWTVDHPKRVANYWFLSHIWGFVSFEKRPLLSVFLAMTQTQLYYSFQNIRCSLLYVAKYLANLHLGKFCSLQYWNLMFLDSFIWCRIAREIE